MSDQPALAEEALNEVSEPENFAALEDVPEAYEKDESEEGESSLENQDIGQERSEEVSGPCLMEYTLESIKPIIEATLFAANKITSFKALTQLFDKTLLPDESLIHDALAELQAEYLERGVQLVQVASGYRFQVGVEVMPWVRQLNVEKPQKYSRAVLETLALIAYRQPITRGEIEEIRGVSVSSHIVRVLQEREWIRVVGHREVPGRPAMFATTAQFLDYFNLTSLQELPPLAEIRDLDKIEMGIQDDLEAELNEEDSQTESVYDKNIETESLDMESLDIESINTENISIDDLAEQKEPELDKQEQQKFDQELIKNESMTFADLSAKHLNLAETEVDPLGCVLPESEKTSIGSQEESSEPSMQEELE